MQIMDDHLKAKFGYNNFREHQKDIITGVLEGEDTLAVLPTGGGKSLLYQFPATYTGKTTVVVSPLISLMNDQCTHLNAIGIPSACYHSESSANPNDIASQTVVYITPEFVHNRLSFLHKYAGSIGLFAIDEAHCVSQWSHDFRTSYLHLGVLKREMPSIPVLAVTATATPRVISDIYTMLGMNEVNEYVLGTRRDNLAIAVLPKTRFYVDIIDIVKESTIIYVQTRKICDEVYEQLTTHGVACTRYHGGMTKQEKENSHQRFMTGEDIVVVATVAFGMGIDKPDIRNVVNYGVPSDIETYYQEIGRAGRDGLPSKATMYYCENDFATMRFLVSQSADPQQVKLKTHSLDLLRTFLADERMCRQQIIEYYFDTGEYPHDGIKREPVPCGICDVCNHGQQIARCDVTREAVTTYDLVKRLERRGSTYGVVKTVDAVRRALGSNVTQTWVRRIVEAMISMEFLTRKLVGQRGNSVVVCGRRNPSDHKPVMIVSAQTTAAKPVSQSASLEHEVRSVLANRHGILATNIMMDRVLLNIQERKPCNVSQLLEVDGISDDFANRYGEEFINEYNKRTRLQSRTHQSNDALSGSMDSVPLYVALKQLRAQQARELELPAFCIFNNAVLVNLVRIRPRTTDKLSKVKGVGPKKIARFGGKIIEICNSDLEGLTNEESDVGVRPDVGVQRHKSKGMDETYRHYTQGKSVEEIAAATGLTPQTIENHILHIFEHYENVDISPDYFGLTTSIEEEIGNAISKVGTDRLRPIKESVSSNVTYTQIKLALLIRRVESC